MCYSPVVLSPYGEILYSTIPQDQMLNQEAVAHQQLVFLESLAPSLDASEQDVKDRLLHHCKTISPYFNNIDVSSFARTFSRWRADLRANLVKKNFSNLFNRNIFLFMEC
jgi:hypothetical protein